MSKKMTELMAFDSIELGTQRSITPEGFLVAPANIARTGVQLYRARELGLDKMGLDSNQIVRLHRPAEELFNPDTMGGFEDKSIIIEPHRTVTKDNWKDMAVGDIHGIHRNGDLLSAQKFIVRDKDGVDTVTAGKKFLSIGYKFDLDMTPGVTADGAAYDGIQRNIRGNHVAITDSPRGGSVCAVADSTEVPEQGVKKMKKVTVNGVPVEVGDSEAGIIETLITERDAARNQKPTVTIKVGDTTKTLTGDQIVKEFEGKDTRIAELEKQVIKPEALEQMINERAVERTKVVGDSARMAPEVKIEDKMTNAQIRRAVVEKVIGGDATSKTLVEAVLAGKTVGDASDDQIAVAFNALSATFKVASVNGADTEVAAALATSKKVTTGDVKDEVKLTGRDLFIANQNKAWQPKQS